MKKLLYIFIIIGIMGGSLAGKAVMGLEGGESEMPIWQVNELNELWKQERAIRDAQCLGDFNCEQEIYSKGVVDLKYRAMSQLLHFKTVATAINPGEKVVKILFMGGDGIYSQWGKDRVKRIKIAWTEDGNKGLANNLVEFFDNRDMKIIYDGSEVELGRDWIPHNEEFTIMVPEEANLINNRMGIFTIGAKGGLFTENRVVDYGECLRDSRYREGMECVAYYSGQGDVRYKLNVENDEAGSEIADEENLVEPGDLSELVEFKESDESNILTLAEVKNGLMPIKKVKGHQKGADGAVALMQVAEPVKEIKKVDDVDLPLSGCSCAEKGDFPWWLVVVLIAGDILVMWWFWPHRQEYKK